MSTVLHIQWKESSVRQTYSTMLVNLHLRDVKPYSKQHLTCAGERQVIGSEAGVAE